MEAKGSSYELTASATAGLFGLETNPETALIHLLPVPWEVTTSYGAGASLGPLAILEASPQLDLFDRAWGNLFEAGYYLHPEISWVKKANSELKVLAQEIISELEESRSLSPSGQKKLDLINEASRKLTEDIYVWSQKIISQGKIPAMIGGDHSCPLGLIRAVCERYPQQVGILHFDAHHDLRIEYQGFWESHASIMNNVLRTTDLKSLTQVAIRDFSESEWALAREQKEKVHVFYDSDLRARNFRGEPWAKTVEEIIATLPQKVYISFDIDGLNPALCPHTGTPVPGGLSFDEAVYLIRSLVEAGREIVGFDLVEVAPESEERENQWDGNVGARLLYQMCLTATKTRSKK